MENKTKNILRSIFMTAVIGLSLIVTLSVGEKETTYICETDRLLDGFTLKSGVNEYPSGTDEDHPAYSSNLEYSVSTASGSGTLLDPYMACVSRGTCTDTSVTLPEYYQEGNTYYKLTAIDQDGFNAQKPVKDSNGSSIGCYDLTSISSLKNFTLVGSQAFAYTSLTTVEFSHNLAELSPSTFFHCKKLETTNFIRLSGEDLSVTGTYATITSVGNNCFADCVKYTGMILPRTLTNIGNGAYQNCLSLTSVFLPATSTEGQHLEIGEYAFAGCSKVTVVYVSSKVERIGAHAFEGCVNAKGYSALTYSELLSKLGKTGNGDWNYLFNDGTYDSEGAHDTFLDFSGRDKKGDLLYDQPYFYSFNGNGTVTLDVYDGSYSTDPNDVYLYNKTRTIPSTRGAGYAVTMIGQELFKNNTDMTSLVVPSSVKEIDIAAFAGCTNLENIAFSGGLVKIGNYAFAPWNGVGTETKSNNLTSLEIPSTVEWIGDYAFPYMYDMTNIEFGGSITDTSSLYHIGHYAFTKAGYSYKDTCIGDNDFSKIRDPLILSMHPKNPETAVTWSGNRPKANTETTYTEIGDYAFYANQWIGSIRIASDRLVFDGYVFADCYWLVEADLGEDIIVWGNATSSSGASGYIFSIQASNNSINDLGGPLENNASTDSKPYVPMSTLYLPELASQKWVGRGAMDGRYQTMVFTSGANSTDNKWFFQWTKFDSPSNIQPTYVDRGSIATVTANGNGPDKVIRPTDKTAMLFSNDESGNSSYSGYYGVDLAGGPAYKQDTYTTSDWYYQIKQGGYYSVKFAHATVTSTTEGLQTTYSTTYKDASGNEISSIDDDTRYGFTLYDSATGRAKFDFVQKAKGSNELIMAKFHYNPYWEQSKNVTVPQTVTFGGRTFTVTEIGNCAFFRNICPQSHAWVSSSSNGKSIRTYYSPQDDDGNTNKDSSGNFYKNSNDIFYNLESVVLPNTITRIGGNAFYMCAGLQSLKTAGNDTEGRFPSGIQKIQQYAFSFTGLTRVSLPNTVTQLGNQHGLCNPFANCLTLQTITVDAGGSTFKSSNNCITNSDGTKIIIGALGNSATSITIPSGVTTLGSQAFHGAHLITSVEIPTSLTTIEAGCFDDLRYGEVLLDNSNKPEKTEKGIFYNKHSILDSMTVAGGATSGLTTIGDLAFYHCDKFNGIDFPNVIRTIGDRAFYDCIDANNYYIPNTLTSVGIQAFYNNTSFNQIRTPAKPTGETVGYLNLAATSLTNLERNAFNISANNFNTISLPSSLTTLNNGEVFTKEYRGLTTVYIHNNTVEMNTNAFQQNYALSTFKTWTGSVDNQGQIPSANISSSNQLPSNLKKIGSSCFYDCDVFPGFSSFPSTLKTVGESAFSMCDNSGFTTANFSDSAADLTISKNAFNNCTKLTDLSLVSTAGSREKVSGSLTIGETAFGNCKSLTSVILPMDTTVGSNPFKGCSSLKRIYVCDTYTDAAAASNKVPSTVSAGTTATVYYYAESEEDAQAQNANAGTMFWHYVGTTPTLWSYVAN